MARRRRPPPEKEARLSNEISVLAERVASAPGWRFELVAFPDVNQASVASSKQVKRWLETCDRVLKADLPEVALLYLASVLETLIKDLAVKYGLDVRSASSQGLARELVGRGLIAAETLAHIKQGLELRNALVHSRSEVPPSRSDVESMVGAIRALQAQLSSKLAA